MLARLEARGFETQTERITPAFNSAERTADLLDVIDAADLVVLSVPVYVDSLPAPVTGLLEAWATAVADGRMSPRPRRLAVLAQCCFPEAHHCDVAIEACRTFAQRTRVGWAGALAFGMGGAIEGRPPERSLLSRRIRHLDGAAEALASDRPIPPEATTAFARPLVPPRAYPLFGRFMWASQARTRGCTEPLTLRRYEQEGQ